MKPRLREAFERELALARELQEKRLFDEAFGHLERAHVLGQRYVRPHVLTHWRMLGLEMQRRALLAVVGQGIRMFLGALGSAVGRVPVGNTGGSNVNMFRPMPIAPELLAMMAEEDARGLTSGQ